jgi:HEAT repeat protein
MIAALQDRRPEVRVEAVTILGMVAEADPAARAALQDAAHDENEAVRAAAERALSGL